MKKVLPIAMFLFASILSYSQNVSVRVAQVSYSSADPDGAGAALGSVVIRYQLVSSAGTIVADGIPFSMVYQSSKLIPSGTNTTTKVGPLAGAATNWTQNIDNRLGNNVSVTYGGQTFDKRMIVSFVEPTATPNVNVTTTNTAYVEITYWTLSNTFPQGGYITPEPGATVPQNELSADGGLTTYPYLSPDLNTPVELGQSTLPVLFTNYDVKCNDKGALLTWGTATEQNTSKFEIQRSKDGANWVAIDNVAAAGNSTSDLSYQYLDLQGGAAFYRIRQVDADGKFVYTDIKRTSCESKNFTVVLYPVPAKENLMVVIKSDKAVRTELQIMDISGRLIRRIPTQINSGNNNISLDVNDLAAGQYLLTSSDPELPINKKFVIAR